MGLFDLFISKNTSKKADVQRTAPTKTRKKAAAPSTPRSGVDCYSYQGRVEDYFADVLTRNFPNYELRRNVAVEAISNPGASAAPAAGWKCACGAVNKGAFCPECGSRKPEPKPVPAGNWTCSCGAKCSGKFCPECGTPRPVSNDWICSCGAKNKGKFCPECGSMRPAAPAVAAVAAPVVSTAPVQSKYPLLTHVLYQNGKPQIAIYVCSKKEYDRVESRNAITQMERACRYKSIAFQRYFREFRNDEAYIRNRVADDLS